MLHTNLHRSHQETSIPFRPDIEGLRAFAVGLVIASHAGLPFLRAGFVGVDVFFVLSGYLITRLLMQEISSSGTVNFARFYARRARRLLPAAITMVLVVCGAESIIMNPVAQVKTLKAALATVLYSSNFYFAHLQQQYFYQHAIASNPLLHTWSLAVEEQFYLIWPVLLLLLARTIKSLRGRTIALAAISLASFVLCVWLTAKIPILAFYAAPARVWEFGAGGLLAFVPEPWLVGRRRLWSWLGAIGILTLTAGAQWIHASMFPGSAAAIPVVGTLLLLMAGVGAPESPAIRLLRARPAQAMGRLSYSLYLWHWPVLVIGQQLVAIHSVSIRLGWIAVACLVAAVTYAVIENPIRRQSFLVARSGLTLWLAALGAILCVGAMGARLAIVSRSEQFRKYDRMVRDIPEVYRNGCTPAILDPHPAMCFFGEINHPQSTVVLFGDSHAAAWFPALQQIADAQHWRLATLVKPGCPPLNMKILPQLDTVCEKWRHAAMGEIEALRPDLVIETSASQAVDADGKSLIDMQVWEQGARDTFAALARQGVKVRFIRDTPFANYDVLGCLAQAEWDGRTQCPAPVPAVALSPGVYAAEKRAAQGFDNVKFLDLSDRMCGPDRCYLEVGGQVICRDGDHLTASFSRTLGEVLFQRLRDSEQRQKQDTSSLY
ncbi:acyltransferase family protein [Terracidiphilus sp.]|uniref:acyltransferase family protein n=1 Tax=Terracidiphilus sp. TaxID=1964191 RepID=UPI003C1CD49C